MTSHGIVPTRITPHVLIERPAENHRLEYERRALVVKTMVKTEKDGADANAIAEPRFIDSAFAEVLRPTRPLFKASLDHVMIVVEDVFHNFNAITMMAIIVAISSIL